MTGQHVIVREPVSGKAGVAVERNPGAPRGQSLMVHQLWDSGEAEPVYIGEDYAFELIAALAEVMADG